MISVEEYAARVHALREDALDAAMRLFQLREAMQALEAEIPAGWDARAPYWKAAGGSTRYDDEAIWNALWHFPSIGRRYRAEPAGVLP